MKCQAHLFMNFLGIRRRRFILWDYGCIQTPNLQAFFFSTRVTTNCISVSGLGERVPGVAEDVRECPKDAALVSGNGVEVKMT